MQIVPYYNNYYFIVRPLTMTHLLDNTSNILQRTSDTAPQTPQKQPKQSMGQCQGAMEVQSWEQLTSIHNEMFSQAQEDFDLLNDQGRPRVDGLLYSQISGSDQLKGELELIRANAPIYQNWTTRKKERYFSKLAENYSKNLRQDDQEHEYSKINDTALQTPFGYQLENSTIVQKSNKKIKKNIKTKSHYKTSQKKNKPLFELQEQPIEQENPKRVLFFHESTVRYFSKAEPSDIVNDERQYLFSTFDKF